MDNAKKYSSVVTEFMDTSRRHPMLPKDEESRLHERWIREGDVQAREALVQANLRHVVSTAMSFRHYPVDLEDLISEGSLGLLVAIDKFDPDKGYRLVTYATYWIRAYIISYIMKSWVKGKTRMSAVRSRMFFKLRRDRARMGALYGPREGLRRLAKDAEMSEEKLSEVLNQLDSPDFPLEASSEGMEWTFFRDRLEADTPSPEDVSESREREDVISGAVRKALGALDKREMFIIQHRMMEDDPDSLAELGRKMGISRERTRQLEMRARRKIVRQLADRVRDMLA
jgi:RNA polymerase sigma-32 factor